MPNKRQLVCENCSLRRSAPDALGEVALDPLGGKSSANTEIAIAETRTTNGDLYILNDKFLWKTVNTEIILRPSLMNRMGEITSDPIYTIK